MYRNARSREIEIAERNRDYTVPEDALRYLRAHATLTELRNAYRRNAISHLEYKRFREIALAGNVEEAANGFSKLMAEKRRA